MMSTLIQKQLEKSSGLKLKLTLNDNRSTMLSVKWEPDCTKVSLHRIFLQAPKNVMDSLACYLRREEKQISTSVKAFIERSLKTLDYSYQLDRSKLYSQGHVYNLQKLYDQINKEYFDGRLKLNITWFGKGIRRSHSKITFGLYHDQLRLVKINRLLDSPAFPEYIVRFVIYHEMLHHVCPPYYDGRGQHHIHTKEFKERERLFKNYNQAQNWIKLNKTSFFL